MITISKLREDIYNVLDRVLTTGVPVEINRKGKVLKIIAPKGQSKFGNNKKHDVLKGDSQSIIHMDWSGEWKT